MDNNENKSYYSSLRGFGRAVPIILITVAAFITACLFSDGVGQIGAPIRAALLGAFSYGGYFIPLLIAIHAIFYAADYANGRVGARLGFSICALLSSSCVEYALTFSEGEAVFSPVHFYNTQSGGGFVGGVIGFGLTHVVGYVGALIVVAAILAIYATFFFADKTGAYGRAAKAFAARLATLLTKVDDKINDANEKKAQIKEEQEYLQREIISEELADDDFFVPRGPEDEVSVDLTYGSREKALAEEAARASRRAEKVLDLSYGLDEEELDIEIPEEKPETTVTNHSLGLDDDPENVFTGSFDPFNFATSEKIASKPSSKATAVEEEIDEFTLYELKANHTPTEREKRMMELEKRKKEWLAKKNAQKAEAEPEINTSEPAIEQPVATEAPTVSSSPVTVTTEPDQKPEVVLSKPKEMPASAPVASEAPKSAAATQPARTVSFETSVPDEVNAYTSYNTTKTTYTTPIDGFSFDNKSAGGDETEDVAILISQKIAASNPAYARSANEMRTFTRVSSTSDDELMAALTAQTPAPAASTAPTSADLVFGSAPSGLETDGKQVFSFDFEPTFDGRSEIEFGVNNSFTAPSPAPVAQAAPGDSRASYERAAEFAAIMAGFNGESAPKDEFKPYTTPAPAEVRPEPVRESIKVERSMLSPSPEVITFNADEPKPYTPVAEAPTAPTVSTPTVSEPVVSTPAPSFEPVSAPVTQPVYQPEQPAEVVTEEPVFTEVEAPSYNGDEIEFTEDESEPTVEEVIYEEEEIAEFVEDDEDDDPTEPEAEPEEAADDQPIPPEEQNPDVIKMRQMFPFLTPIGEQAPEQETAEEQIPEDEDDDLPFDEPTAIIEEPKEAPVTALVPKSDAKSESKKKKQDYANYQFPSIELLAKEESSYDGSIQSEIQENADKLIDTLGSFGVVASIKGVDRGPRITRYEVVPAKGVKVSSILNLQDDIALNLAAGSIRMEAPIPGKSAVGIEIPNKKSSIVRLRNLLETEDFISSKSKTFVCIGRDVAGQPVFGDISKMPHLLIAGATGMGKSVCINSLLISVLYKARPDEVKLIMIDPKQVEFTMYNGIPHLLVPVVSDAKQAAGSLMWAVEEMERRHNLLNPLCVRNIDAYNEKVTADPSLGDPMPRIIIVIDEFADLMLQVKDPVENLVMRIAQKARAAGIHLIIGTQRPAVNVITGTIKANVPSRISCKVASNVDSRTVLDAAGAEKLLNKGDMLFAYSGAIKPLRVQGAFVTDSEVEDITNHLKKFATGNDYDTSVMEEIERAAQRCNKKGGGGDDDDDRAEGSSEGYLNDKQFLDAVEIAVNTGKISTSLIQRKISVGYGKAAKFIDIMEDMGIVGESNGQKPRDVLISPDEWREKLARTMLD